MSDMTDTERAAIRRFCGYPALGADIGGFRSWRFYQANGLFEFRINYLTEAEKSVVRQYLDQLALLESVDAREPGLFDGWRRRLCGFLGVPPGPLIEAVGEQA